MKKSYIVTFLCLFVLLQQSCTKDKGNYIYTDINTVDIQTNVTTFTIEQLDQLTIKPTIVESKPNTQNQYTYEWLIFPTTTSTLTQVNKEVATLLSTKKDLDTIISQPPNSYFIQYNVINKATGIKSIKRFNVNVVASFYQGWMVMTNTNNLGKLSFIRNDDVIYLDPIKDANNISLKGKGIASHSGISGQLKEIYVFTSDEILKLSANDFNIIGSDNSLFMQAPPVRMPSYSINTSNSEQFIITNGKLHVTTVPSFFGPASKFSVAIEGAYNNLFPFTFHGDNPSTAVYDTESKKFLKVATFDRSLSLFTPNQNNKYDLNNVDKTMVAADLGAQKIYDIIMKNDNNEFFYYAFDPNTKVNIQALSFHQIQNSPNIHQAISFASSSSIGHIYYATEDKIYLYDILANTSRLLYQFSNNTKIKMLSMYKYKGWGAASVTDPIFNKRLVVAANNGTQGSVYYFSIAPTGDFENQTFSKVFTGFGEIEHINYRNPNN